MTPLYMVAVVFIVAALLVVALAHGVAVRSQGLGRSGEPRQACAQAAEWGAACLVTQSRA
jgi:hypothetical protein